VSIPLWTTTTRSGSTAGYTRSTSLRICPETAMTASAASSDAFSQKLETAYPPPSCSAFHDLKGSRLWAVATWGIR
jgi:hypothetical protein